MKPVSISLFLLLLTSNLLAQNNFSGPLQLNRNFLVHSAGLPQEYLLFVPDSATQVLFNPARANNFTTSFLYVNYFSDFTPGYIYPVNFPNYEVKFYPGTLQKSKSFNFPSLNQVSFTSSKNPTFSAAALLNTGGTKWLFELTNGINMSTISNSIHSSENDIFSIVPNYNLAKNYSAEHSTDDGMTTSLKISRIFQSGGLNISTGLFGIINKDNQNELDESFLDYYHFADNSDGSKFRQRVNQYVNHTMGTNNSRYIIGGEFTINHKYWDYLFTIDYQWGDNSVVNVARDLTVSYDSSYYQGTGWNTSNFNNLNISNQHTNQKPSFINITNYFRHLINLITPDDNVFLTLNLFFSSGQISYVDNNYSIYSNVDTNSFSNTNRFDAKNIGASFSTGYSLSKSFSDLYILSGLRFSGNLENLGSINKINNNYHYSGFFVRSKMYPSNAALTLPVYLNYTATDWCSLYGGFNYSYRYIRNKIEYSTVENQHNTMSPDMILNTQQDFVLQAWQSSKSIYAGFELRHKSGIKLQFYIDNDFALIKDWNVSLGYHF